VRPENDAAECDPARAASSARVRAGPLDRPDDAAPEPEPFGEPPALAEPPPEPEAEPPRRRRPEPAGVCCCGAGAGAGSTNGAYGPASSPSSGAPGWTGVTVGEMPA
jgi:hypothetical protein